MWNDEDNNPYGAFDSEARLSESLHSAALSPRNTSLPHSLISQLTLSALYDREHSPSPSSRSSSQDPPDYITRPQDLSDEDEPEGYSTQQTSHGYPRKSRYDSRIEQILYENPDMPILITDAGKNHEGGGSFIVYTIRTGVRAPLERLEPRCSRILGSRSPTTILRVRFLATDAGQPSSHARHPPDPGEAYNGRLCCQAYKSQGRLCYYRFAQADACRLLEQVSPDEGGSGRWSMVEIPRSER